MTLLEEPPAGRAPEDQIRNVSPAERRANSRFVLALILGAFAIGTVGSDRTRSWCCRLE